MNKVNKTKKTPTYSLEQMYKTIINGNSIYSILPKILMLS